MPIPVSPYRVFSEKTYVTNFTAYPTKEAATGKINDLKQKHGKLLARVVERKEGFIIYFEESFYKQIFGNLPPKPIGALTPKTGIPTTKPAKKRTIKTEKSTLGTQKPGIKKTPMKLNDPFGLVKQSPIPVRSIRSTMSKSPTPERTISSTVSKSPTPARAISTTVTKSPRKISRPPVSAKKVSAMPPVEIYGPPPPYLLARMNKDAQRYYLAKDVEFERMPPKQVDKLLEIYNAELLKFDVNFEMERPVIGRIKEIQNLLNARKKKLDEEDITRFLTEKVKVPLDNGKFAKVLQKYDGFNVRMIADAIIKEIGRGRKECPLSDYALAQEITDILKKKFPEKYRN
ncbi:MAG: hypothetical protein RBG13Loki_0146 [Promethearchaeota archaeon CR_4]|nr:MAG: hypothetical protein RBG13Loki_0146 [Candidatus Lokiarchaeota archaeon CR_4]